MGLPFTADQFFGVFEAYNLSVWPAQIGLLLAAMGIVVLPQLRRGKPDRIAAGLLGGLWLWTGLVYHLLFFADVNPAAYAFAALFASEGALLVAYGRRLCFRARWDAAGIAGGALIVYALVIYPILGFALGHRFPASPTFGAPCPLVIFTLGVLLWTEPHAALPLLWIPAAWALIGVTAVGAFGMVEDIALPVAAAIALILSIARRRRPSPAPHPGQPEAHRT